MRRQLTYVLLFVLTSLTAVGQEVKTDSVTVDSLGSLPFYRKGIIGKVVHYFDDTNKPEKANKKFDFSIIGGPYYSSDTKFGIGVVAAGLYRTDLTDTVTPPSDVSIYAKATTSMMFTLGVNGNHITRGDAARLVYDVNFSSIKTKFWGIGYAMDVDDSNECEFKYLNSQARASYMWKVAPNLYVGPLLSFDYINGRDFGKPWLWNGEDARTFNFGAGIAAQYDSRDNLTAPQKGMYIRLDQRFNPRFMLNRYAFSMTELTFNAYHKVWKGGILAYSFHTRLTYGNTPWGLLSTLGGSSVMRGYYEGRYRDKSEIDVCIELRQHIWRRNGLVAWVGGGTVFPSFSQISTHKLLPNYGIGYRWEFKQHVNVRLDLGFGRHQTGFIFSINEAF